MENINNNTSNTDAVNKFDDTDLLGYMLIVLENLSTTFTKKHFYFYRTEKEVIDAFNEHKQAFEDSISEASSEADSPKIVINPDLTTDGKYTCSKTYNINGGGWSSKKEISYTVTWSEIHNGGHFDLTMLLLNQ